MTALSMITAGAALVSAASGAAAAGQDSGPWVAGWNTEFSGSSLPAGCQTYSGTYNEGANAWSPSAVSISEGLLHIRLEHKQTEGRAWTSGGIGCWGKPQTYGRYEIRARIPRGAGIDSYFALWPTQGGEGRWTGVEMLAPGKETAYITNGWGPAKQGSPVSGSYSDEFHTYVVEWTPEQVRITQDGTQLFASDRAYSGARYLVIVVSNGDKLTGVPNGSTPLPAEFLIDRIRVDRYQAGATAQPSAPDSAATATVVPSASASSAAGTAAVTGAQPSAVEASVGDAPADTSATSGLLPLLVVVPLLLLVLAGAIRAYVHSPQRAARAAATEPPPAPAHPDARRSAVGPPAHSDARYCVPEPEPADPFGAAPPSGWQPVGWDSGPARGR
ncbi:MAG TPA: family 16 glycosylhydrolase [Kineosporiaceae bacterium]|nr:family 16 glycosylhydrolase [Kineosporiaceae bacterium]